MTSDFLTAISQGLQSGQNTDFLSTLRQGLNNPQPQSTTPVAPPPPNFGIPHEQIQSDVQNLKAKGTPLADIHSTIDSLPQITDKKGAKDFAAKVYHNLEGVDGITKNSGGALTPINSKAGTGDPNLHYDSKGRVFYIEPKKTTPKPKLI